METECDDLSEQRNCRKSLPINADEFSGTTPDRAG